MALVVVDPHLHIPGHPVLAAAFADLQQSYPFLKVVAITNSKEEDAACWRLEGRTPVENVLLRITVNVLGVTTTDLVARNASCLNEYLSELQDASTLRIQWLLSLDKIELMRDEGFNCAAAMKAGINRFQRTMTPDGQESLEPYPLRNRKQVCYQPSSPLFSSSSSSSAMVIVGSGGNNNNDDDTEMRDDDDDDQAGFQQYNDTMQDVEFHFS